VISWIVAICSLVWPDTRVSQELATLITKVEPVIICIPVARKLVLTVMLMLHIPILKVEASYSSEVSVR
jgi:hypothetical protein